MNCMKCGREVESDNAFCEECLEVMAKYPVRQDIVIQLPNRNVEQLAKKTHHLRRKLAMSPEEQVVWLKKKCRRLAAAFLVTLLLALGLGVLAGVSIYELDLQKLWGRNYSTSESASPSDGN